MCGITGIIHLNGDPVSSNLLQQMTDVIAHRRPDGEGQWDTCKSEAGWLSLDKDPVVWQQNIRDEWSSRL